MAASDVLDLVQRVGTTLVSLAVAGFVLYEKIHKSSPSVAVSLNAGALAQGAQAPGPGGDTLPPLDSQTAAAVAFVRAEVADVRAKVLHEASRIDAIERSRETEREERREDSREDRESRERLSNSLALLHGKLDARGTKL